MLYIFRTILLGMGFFWGLFSGVAMAIQMPYQAVFSPPPQSIDDIEGLAKYQAIEGIFPDSSWMEVGAVDSWLLKGVKFLPDNLGEVISSYQSGLDPSFLIDAFLDGYIWRIFRSDPLWSLEGHAMNSKVTQYPILFDRRIRGALNLEDFVEGLPSFVLINGSALSAFAVHLKLGEPEIEQGTKYFWNAQLLVHRSKNHYFGVRMLSLRNRSIIPKSSSYSAFLARDGSALVMQVGDEYQYIKSFVPKVAKFPGVTAKAVSLEGLFSFPTSDYQGRSLFAGGVADGKRFSHAAFHYHRLNPKASLKAKKAYFMATFNENHHVMACLGNSIEDLVPERKEAIYTTLNQTLLQDDIFYIQGGKKQMIPKEGYGDYVFDLTEPAYFIHGGLAYVVIPFEEKTRVVLKKIQGGLKVDFATDDKVQADIFELAIEHKVVGTKDKPAGGYQYMIVTNVSRYSIPWFLESLQDHVIVNNQQAQIMLFLTKNGSADQAVFQGTIYEPGRIQLPGNRFLQVDKPVVFLLEMDGTLGTNTLYVSDPYQTIDNTVTFSIGDSTTGELLLSTTVDFPQDSLIGKPISFRFLSEPVVNRKFFIKYHHLLIDRKQHHENLHYRE